MKTLDLTGLGSVPAMGIGCMGMSEFYGPAQDTDASLRLLRAATEGGIQMLDTADFYGDGDNERLIGRFLTDIDRDRIVVATKCGIKRGSEILADGNFRREFDGSPEYITKCAEASVRRLGVECIDLFYLHRVDPKVAIEESASAMQGLIDRGLIRAWGVSEPDGETLRRAHTETPVCAVQSEYSLWFRDVETGILPLCQQLGIGFVAYAPLGRGIVPTATPTFAKGDFRLTLERAQPETLDANAALYAVLQDCGALLDLSVYQVMLSWLLHPSQSVMAIPGMRKLANLSANLHAADTILPDDIMTRLNTAFAPGQVHGGRYTVDPSVSESFAAVS
jgi:aryl-alcohol dehydrogenase-like predicted oxidoreductase